MRNKEQAFISSRLAKSFDEAWKGNRIILFSGPAGCGKTTSALALLRGRSVLSAAVGRMFPEPGDVPPGIEVVLVDDLQLLCDPDEQQRLLDLMRTRRDLRFVLVGRCRVPGWLMPFRLAGDMAIIGIENLMFDVDTTRLALEAHGSSPSSRELVAIDRDLQGFPVAIAFLGQRLEGDAHYDETILDGVIRDLFAYFEDSVYDRLPQPCRRLMLDCAFLDSFDIELAKTVSGNNRAGEVVSELLRNSSMLLFDGVDSYHFWEVFQRFLQWEARQRLSDEEIRETFGRAALHYELVDDVAQALTYYSKAGDNRKVREMLERNSDLHPGAGHYLEMADHYLTLPDEEIRKSPSLMCGMSMLTAMALDFEASDGWYHELERRLSTMSRSDSEYADVRGRLVYLDIALPQTGTKGLANVLKGAATMMGNGSVNLPAFSVTSTMPSILNGGKDFSDWTKIDDLLYVTMRKPIEAVLGRDGVGLAECAICESKFEKGQDISTRLLTLMSRLGEIQAKGTPDIEFALAGLVARAQVMQGKPTVAISSIENLRTRFVERDETRFLPNIDAMLCRIRLRLGQDERTSRWLETEAPADGSRLWVFWRYRYITKMQVLIAENRCDEALLVSAQLYPYCQRCGRVMDGLTLELLSAICMRRLQNRAWRDEMRSALDTCLEYSYVTPVAQLGIAIQPLLTECGWNRNADFLDKLVSATRQQAIRYPRYLSSAPALAEPLSNSEMQVLRLVNMGMSNKRIAETLGVKLPTVKTHVSHILQKTGTSSRIEAKAIAEELHLV